MPSFIPTHAMSCACILMAKTKDPRLPHAMVKVWCEHKQLRSRFKINGVKCGQMGYTMKLLSNLFTLINIRLFAMWLSI